MAHGSPRGADKNRKAPDPRDLDDLVQAPEQATAAETLANLYQHFLQITPRGEDLDISENATGGQANTTPQKHLTINAGAEDTFVLKPKAGAILHVTAIRIERENAIQGGNFTSIEVDARKGARRVAWLPGRTDYTVPIVLDREDELRVKIQNGTAGAIGFHVFVEGFARRIVKTLQPDRQAGRS